MLKFAKSKKTARGGEEKSTFEQPRASVPVNGKGIPTINLDGLMASNGPNSSRNHNSTFDHRKSSMQLQSHRAPVSKNFFVSDLDLSQGSNQQGPPQVLDHLTKIEM